MQQKFRKTRKNKDFIEIYGIHAVQAALKNQIRKHQKLIISLNNKHLFLKNIIQKEYQTKVLQNTEFVKIYGSDNSHQGVILKTSNLEQPNINDIINESNKKIKEVIVMLDHVTDPHNIGSIMRSCALFNCNSIIVAKNNSPNITSTMAKAASGALEIVNYIRVTNISETIKKFKKNDFWVLGFNSNSNKINNNFSLPKKCLLIFGAEGKGLRLLTKRECDQIVTIPANHNIQFNIESLNVANACSIALYEHFKSNE